MKADIQEFNELTAPSIAEDLHAQIIEKNKVLSEEIQTYLQQLKMDNFDAAAYFRGSTRAHEAPSAIGQPFARY